MEKCKKVMKRRKKQTLAAGQLSLFEVAPVRQEEETRPKPKIKPVEASKSAAPILIPPAPVEAVKTPENSLKTEMPDREELHPMCQRRNVLFSPRGGVKRVKTCKNVFYIATF